MRLRDAVHDVELWRANGAVAAFVDGQLLATLSDVVLSYTDDGRLAVAGVERGTTTHELWEGVGDVVQRGKWTSATVTWPDGAVWRAAEVSWSQYGVVVSAAGHARRELPGARTEIVGVQRWIVDGDVRILADAKRKGCGCRG
jgi:hypothetical protein